MLVFHGIILRSQLVTLLQHKIFFREAEGVKIACFFKELLHGESVYVAVLENSMFPLRSCSFSLTSAHAIHKTPHRLYYLGPGPTCIDTSTLNSAHSRHTKNNS